MRINLGLMINPLILTSNIYTQSDLNGIRHDYFDLQINSCLKNVHDNP